VVFMRQLGTQTITSLLVCNKELFLMQTIPLINQKDRGGKTTQIGSINEVVRLF